MFPLEFIIECMPRTYNPIKDFFKRIWREFFSIYSLMAVIIIVSLLIFKFYWPERNTTPIEVAVKPAEIVELGPLHPRILDGLEATAEDKIMPRNVTVMVENNVESWPLIGLDKASIVYEALAEGRIPRFLAVFSSDTKIEKIGPVRSARTYYLELAKPFDGLYMHVGGSPDALIKIKAFGIADFDQYYFDKYYWRDNVTRYAPHNVYTSSDLINKLIEDRKLSTDSGFSGWKYKNSNILTEEALVSFVQPKDIVVSYTTGTYQAKYVYLKEKNQYQRYQAKEPMKLQDGANIFVDNVIVEEHNQTVYDAIGRKNMDIIGEGKAWIFRDGQSFEVTWKKSKTDELTRYFDKDLNEIELNRGKTWINIVEPGLFTYVQSIPATTTTPVVVQ